MQPLGNCLHIHFLLLLVHYSHQLLFRICQTLKALIGGVEIDLAHLLCPEWYFELSDYLYEFVHTEKGLGDASLVEGN